MIVGGVEEIRLDEAANEIYVFAGQRVQRFVPAASPRGKVLDQLARTPLF